MYIFCFSCFKEMPSVNWRENADNWFGNCCCTFGGVSEKLVAEYAKSYTCVSGVCLLNSTAVVLSTSDILGCKFPDVLSSQNVESDSNPQNINYPENGENETSKHVGESDNLSSTFSALQIGENKGLMNEETRNCHITCCTSNISETSSKVLMNEENVELLDNQKMFLDGYLGNGFMVRSSELSKDIRWISYLCPECSCLLGAYPTFGKDVPLDGGIRLFKCYISTCLPTTGSSDAFE